MLNNFWVYTFFFIIFLSSSRFIPAEAYRHSNPNGNITIKWDLINWTPDGYVAIITLYLYNFQKRPIRAPGWQLSWTWAKNEVIWTTLGCKATHQGDCSMFKGYIPSSCKKSPTIVDLSPNTPYDQQVENCCRGGLLDAWSSRPQSRSISSFQLSVGSAGNTDRDVKLPKNFDFKAPGGIYACGPAKVIERTKYITRDKRRSTRALMTWKVICKHSG